MNNHKQKGFIILMMFVMLTLCATLVSLFITKGTVYRYSMNTFLNRKKMNIQLQSGLAVAQNLITIQQEDGAAAAPSAGQANAAQASSSSGETDLLMKLYTNLSRKVTPEMLGTTVDSNMMLSVVVETGKLNINGLYDFSKKKFVKEGEGSGDRKKLSQWVFDRIAQTGGGKSLFEPFSEFLKNRKFPLNDVTELLAIPEFAQYFYEAVFYDSSQKEGSHKKLYLSDLFTVVSETDTIQPWALSPSLIKILGGSVSSLDSKKIEASLKNFAAEMDWPKNWDGTVGNLYGIKFDNLSEEMKSILTAQFEATIFSITLKVHDHKNKVGLSALLKKKTEKSGQSTYDILRMYQI